MSASVSWLTLAITGSCFPSLPKFVVGVGGFLGMGEKDVAVPFNAVQVTNKNNNKWHLVMNSTKDALKNAKGFKYDRNAMTWISEDAPATTGAPANPPPRSNSR